MSVQNAMTADFLRSAYGGESMAHMRYLIWGDAAEKEGMPNIGRLFRAIAYAEWAHAGNHFHALGEQKGEYTVPAGAVFGMGKAVENLQGAINGELHEIKQMYPVYLETARFQAKNGKDMQLNTVYVCPICGYTETGDVPDICPICGAKKEKFKTF